MKVISFATSAGIRKKFEEIEVDPVAIEMMVEKFEFLIVEIPQVRNVEANILKQEMLVLGGEAALHKGTISCSVPHTPVVLAGTRKMFRKLIERIRPQIGTLPTLAQDLQNLLFNL